LASRSTRQISDPDEQSDQLSLPASSRLDHQFGEMAAHRRNLDTKSSRSFFQLLSRYCTPAAPRQQSDQIDAAAQPRLARECAAVQSDRVSGLKQSVRESLARCIAAQAYRLPCTSPPFLLDTSAHPCLFHRCRFGHGIAHPQRSRAVNPGQNVANACQDDQRAWPPRPARAPLTRPRRHR
jgi:hypothetical protein